MIKDMSLVRMMCDSSSCKLFGLWLFGLVPGPGWIRGGGHESRDLNLYIYKVVL